jgi:glycyl-tRNA synthetase
MEITGIADRGCWDLTRHAQFSGTDMSHFKKFDEPVEMEVDKVKAKHKLLGPKFKAKAKDIAVAIEAKDPEEAKTGKIVINVDGEDIELTDEFFEVVRVNEKVSGKRVVPHVIEPSHGLDRIFYSVLEQSYDYDEKEDYTVLHLRPEVAPIKVGVFPLMEKDGLDTFAMDLYEKLQAGGIASVYDGSGTIGKRYARMDEVGTPYCVTVDYESLEGDLKDTVTIRDRDSKQQKRVPVEKVGEIVRNLMSGADFDKI